MKEVPKYLIESPHAAESGSERNVRQRHSRFVNELLGKEYAPRLCNRDGRGPQMLQEQPPKLASADTQTIRQRFDVIVVAIEGAIGDERECAGNGVRSSAP
jgi:hypothetical protein